MAAARPPRDVDRDSSDGEQTAGAGPVASRGRASRRGACAPSRRAGRRPSPTLEDWSAERVQSFHRKYNAHMLHHRVAVAYCDPPGALEKESQPTYFAVCWTG